MTLNVLSLLLLLRIFALKADQELKDAPCDYRDTVALDSSEKLANGSYLYDNITLVPVEHTGTYNYEIHFGKEKIPSEIHVRGCICDKLRPCLPICCPNDEEYTAGFCTETPYVIHDSIIIKTNEGKTADKYIPDLFTLKYHRPCEMMFCLTQDSNNTFEYSLFENGSIFFKNAARILGYDEFCMAPVLDHNSEFRYSPWACIVPNPKGTDEIIKNGIIMLSSVPFMLVTIIMSIMSGKKLVMIRSTCFYLVSLSVAFTTLPIINLTKNLSSTVCPLLGYTTYFAFMASYSWLFVISCDFYWNLSKPANPYTQCRDLTFYSLFAWGLPTFLLGIILIAQRQDWPDQFKANIGGRNYCFFEQNNYNMLIYFYGPGMVLISSNVVMFFLTIKQISNCRKLKNACKPKAIGFKQKLHVYMKKCGLLAKLTLVTGVSWSFEFSAYWLNDSEIIKYLLYFVECQGYLIFLLVVFRKSNRIYLKERYQQIFEGKNTTDFHRKRNKSMSTTQQTTLSTHKAVVTHLSQV